MKRKYLENSEDSLGWFWKLSIHRSSISDRLSITFKLGHNLSWGFYGFNKSHGGNLALSGEQPSHLDTQMSTFGPLVWASLKQRVTALSEFEFYRMPGAMLESRPWEHSAMSLHLGDTDKSTQEELQFEYLKNWISSVHNREVAENVTCPFKSLALGISAQGDSRILVQHPLVLRFASVVV